jgi:hypothetical protein
MLLKVSLDKHQKLKDWNKMKEKLSSFIGILAIFFLGFWFVGNFNNSFQSVSSQLKKEVDELQKNMPEKIDDYSTATRVAFDDNTLSYDFLLKLQIQKKDAEKFQKMQRNANIFAACVDPTALNALKNDITVEFNYTLTSNQIKFTNVIIMKDCQPFLDKDALALGDYYVKLQNLNVPIAIDDETDLVSYRRVGMAMELNYQLPGWKVVELDVPYFINILQGLVPTMCTAPDWKVLLDRGYEIKLNYFDVNNEKITAITANC